MIPHTLTERSHLIQRFFLQLSTRVLACSVFVDQLEGRQEVRPGYHPREQQTSLPT